ncbi:MAG: hypothetical protein OEY23_15535 [Acidimicrobiia bacterium]|nr:hypothetical protein [Acidimicrobiia bacterium]
MTASVAMLLAVHLLATSAMAGLIWFVQIVHYPLFDSVGVDGFGHYEVEHQRRTAWVVGPAMAVEGVSALVIAASLRDEVGLVLPLVGLALLAGIHASTIWLQVPAHAVLLDGHDRSVTRRLVSTNWIRTVGWSARSMVAALMLVAATEPLVVGG